jgi:hypothetical protein
MKPLQFVASFFNVTLKTPTGLELAIAIFSWLIVTSVMLVFIPGMEGNKSYALSFAIFAGAFLHACGANIRQSVNHFGFVLFVAIAFGGIGNLAYKVAFG